MEKILKGAKPAELPVERPTTFESVLNLKLVGLPAVAAYQNFSGVSDLVTKESSSLGALYRDLRGYPQPAKGRLGDSGPTSVDVFIRVHRTCRTRR